MSIGDPENTENIFDAGTHNADGVDLTQIREMLAMTHLERLRWLEKSVNSQLALQKNMSKEDS